MPSFYSLVKMFLRWKNIFKKFYEMKSLRKYEINNLIDCNKTINFAHLYLGVRRLYCLMQAFLH